jgi:cytochrome b6-f complex iron-sulfur subunit
MADDRQRADAAELFAEYVDALLGDGRPSPHSVADADEAQMARVAAELAGSIGEEPDPAFVEQLRLRMREADRGIATVRSASPPRGGDLRPIGGGRVAVSRRALLQAGLGAAVGLAAGAAGISWLRQPPPAADRPDQQRVVSGPGAWVEVAHVDQVAPGDALRFTTAEFDGYLVNDGGEIRALSSVCSHMACTLEFRRREQDLRCPCHGARFDLEGRLANGRDRWAGGYDGEAPYPIDLPPLVRPQVKVDGERILVWIARA